MTNFDFQENDFLEISIKLTLNKDLLKELQHDFERTLILISYIYSKRR